MLANDDNLYAGNGDGTGFGDVYTDMAVSRISGTPRELTGTTIATNVARIWSGSVYTANRRVCSAEEEPSISRFRI